MICGRCQAKIKDDESESLISFTNFLRKGTKSANLCEKCSAGFIEWFASGNYIQKKINQEERQDVRILPKQETAV